MLVAVSGFQFWSVVYFYRAEGLWGVFWGFVISFFACFFVGLFGSFVCFDLICLLGPLLVFDWLFFWYAWILLLLLLYLLFCIITKAIVLYTISIKLLTSTTAHFFGVYYFPSPSGEGYVCF